MSIHVGNRAHSYHAMKDTLHAATATRLVLNNFLSRTEISVDGFRLEGDSALEQRVRTYTTQWNLGHRTPDGFDGALVNAVWIAGCAYSHTPLDVQVHIALYTLLATCVDDLSVPLIALEEFMERFYSRAPQLHPILDLLADNILGMGNYFPSFPTKIIIKSTIDFINMMAFEQNTQTMPLRPAAMSYITMKRLYNGAADAYFCFVFDKFAFPNVSSYIQALPDGGIFICYANDLCSFYKEELAQETANLVHDRAMVCGTDSVTSLKGITNDMIDAVVKTRIILDGHAEKGAWERFMGGYIAYHQLSPRYRLAEVLRNDN